MLKLRWSKYLLKYVLLPSKLVPSVFYPPDCLLSSIKYGAGPQIQLEIDDIFCSQVVRTLSSHLVPVSVLCACPASTLSPQRKNTLPGYAILSIQD